MKPRHATALALVGWYLMAPPLLTNGEPNTNAPLARWQLIEAFDTAEKCVWVRGLMTHPTGDVRARASQCISTDDPRLKGN